MKKLLIILPVTILLYSCATSNRVHYQKIHGLRSGIYKIDNVRDTIIFRNVAGKYYIDTTLLTLKRY